MRYEVLEQYFGQLIDASVTSRGTITGILKECEADGNMCDTVELEPENERTRKRYGSYVVEASAIVYIRPIKPHVDDDEDDCKDCEESA